MINKFLYGFIILLVYFLLAASLAMLARKLLRMPRELFRKTLHLVLLFSLPVFLYAFPTWLLSALAAISFAAAIYPILAFGERFDGYSELLTQRKDGEIKRSLMLVFLMFAVIIGICWGWLGDRMLAVACIYAWGFGDGAAALVGKRFGRHYLQSRMIEGRKSLEGTLAMFFVSFFSVFIIMMFRGGLNWQHCFVIALAAGAVSALVELFTLGGFDTVTCPMAAASIIIPLTVFWEGIPL